MNSPNTWTSWSLRLGDKAYKGVRPLGMEMFAEEVDKSTGFLWRRVQRIEKTGRWCIKFIYDRGPFSGIKPSVDHIFFDDEDYARQCYDSIFSLCFLERTGDVQLPPSPPNKPKSLNKNNPLRLV
jgi:hypothetical protein